MYKNYPLPDHKYANCYIEEDDTNLLLISNDIKISTFNKNTKSVKIIANEVENDTKHIKWFIDYVNSRFHSKIEFNNLHNIYVLNMDQEYRDSFILGTENWGYFGGCQHFTNMNTGTLVKVLNEKFAPSFSRQNYAPTLLRMAAFALQHMDTAVCFFNGYLIDSSREDYRVSIDTITCYTDAPETIKEFKLLARTADVKSFDPNTWEYYAWWD